MVAVVIVLYLFFVHLFLFQPNYRGSRLELRPRFAQNRNSEREREAHFHCLLVEVLKNK